MNGPTVYIDEMPGAVRTIAGVATAVALFVGWALRGPTDRALHVTSFAEYERRYGGLDGRSNLGYALRHFFLNGGSDAHVIRLVDDDATVASCSLGPVVVAARSPGQWANSLQLSFTRRLEDPGRFDLRITDASGALLEAFDDLSISASDERYAPKQIDHLSSLIGSVSVSAMATEAPEGVIPFGGDVAGHDGSVIAPGPIGTEGIRFRSKLLQLFDAGGIVDQIGLLNLICVPGLGDQEAIAKLLSAARRMRAFVIVDSPEHATPATVAGRDTLGAEASYGALYFPWVLAHDPLAGHARHFPPCGFIAGIFARNDAARGVWKAPAGTEARLRDAVDPVIALTTGVNDQLNRAAVNCLRKMNGTGTIVWGARTMQGADGQGSDWKYVPVRRLALFIEESIYKGTQWVVFEPNGEVLWAQIRMNVGAFLHSLFQQGAFQGSKANEAYFVKCDESTTTRSDVDLGVVNILVGFAPLKPAEFLVIKIRQIVAAGT